MAAATARGRHEEAVTTHVTLAELYLFLRPLIAAHYSLSGALLIREELVLPRSTQTNFEIKLSLSNFLATPSEINFKP